MALTYAIRKTGTKLIQLHAGLRATRKRQSAPSSNCLYAPLAAPCNAAVPPPKQKCSERPSNRHRGRVHERMLLKRVPWVPPEPKSRALDSRGKSSGRRSRSQFQLPSAAAAASSNESRRLNTQSTSNSSSGCWRE